MISLRPGGQGPRPTRIGFRGGLNLRYCNLCSQEPSKMALLGGCWGLVLGTYSNPRCSLTSLTSVLLESDHPASLACAWSFLEPACNSPQGLCWASWISTHQLTHLPGDEDWQQHSPPLQTGRAMQRKPSITVTFSPDVPVLRSQNWPC